MKLLFATTNAHKVSEVRDMLAGTDIELDTLASWPDLPEAPETADTFEANAIMKAQFIFNRTGIPCIADDSGIEVDALDGRPGVHSKRFSTEGTASANNALLLKLLADRTDRGARFRCALAFVNGTRIATVDGSCEGQIAISASGVGGFGYDPLFLPTEAPGRSMAELSSDEKNAISHRGRAFARIEELLNG